MHCQPKFASYLRTSSGLTGAVFTLTDNPTPPPDHILSLVHHTLFFNLKVIDRFYSSPRDFLDKPTGDPAF